MSRKSWARFSYRFEDILVNPGSSKIRLQVKPRGSLRMLETFLQDSHHTGVMGFMS